MSKILLLAFLMLSGSTILYSQEEKIEENEDVLELEIEEDDIFDEEELSLKKQLGNFKHPFIKLSTGISTPTFKGETGETIDNFKAIFGFKKYNDKLYKKDKNNKSDKIIKELSYNGLLVENYSNESGLFNSEPETNYQLSYWNFGFAHGEGYGYKLGEHSDIILGQESGFSWLKMQYAFDINRDAEGNALTEFDFLQQRLGDDVRFSSYFESFVKIRPLEFISLDLGYQRNIIYPRFQFWYWTVSGLTEGVASAVTDAFIKKISKSSPYAGPAVNFILKNAISYAFMELRKKNMNWPISGEEPLIINSFNLGINLHF